MIKKCFFISLFLLFLVNSSFTQKIYIYPPKDAKNDIDILKFENSIKKHGDLFKLKEFNLYVYFNKKPNTYIGFRKGNLTFKADYILFYYENNKIVILQENYPLESDDFDLYRSNYTSPNVILADPPDIVLTTPIESDDPEEPLRLYAEPAINNVYTVAMNNGFMTRKYFSTDATLQRVQNYLGSSPKLCVK